MNVDCFLQNYQMDVEGTKRRFEQKHMVNWIVDSVVKGITPDQVDTSFILLSFLSVTLKLGWFNLYQCLLNCHICHLGVHPSSHVI